MKRYRYLIEKRILVGFTTCGFAVLILISLSVLPACVHSAASEQSPELRSREILELLKNQKFDTVSDKFVLPTSYSPSRQLKERKKIATFIDTLFAQLGEVVEISPSNFKGKLYSLTVTSGDNSDWVKRELDAKTTVVRHAIDFEHLGDVFIDLSFAEIGEDDWGLYSLGLGDSEESSDKTKRLNQIGYEIVRRLALESTKP